MAEVELNPVFISVSGRIGNMVFYKTGGRLFARSYVVPRNADTSAQRVNRSFFASAVNAWQSLSVDERGLWNAYAALKGRKGYNLFISEFIKRGGSPDLPVHKNKLMYTYGFNRQLKYIASPLYLLYCYSSEVSYSSHAGRGG